jgi:hypothetical protein
MGAPPLIVRPGRPWRAGRRSPLRGKFLFRGSINLCRPETVTATPTALVQVGVGVMIGQESNQ